MNLRELYEGGYIQEANRQFFHPLGMALTVLAKEGTGLKYDNWDNAILVVSDNRKYKDGMCFSAEVTQQPKFYIKAKKIADEQFDRFEYRINKLGYIIQPVQGLHDDPSDGK